MLLLDLMQVLSTNFLIFSLQYFMNSLGLLSDCPCEEIFVSNAVVGATVVDVCVN